MLYSFFATHQCSMRTRTSPSNDLGASSTSSFSKLTTESSVRAEDFTTSVGISEVGTKLRTWNKMRIIETCDRAPHESQVENCVRERVAFIFIDNCKIRRRTMQLPSVATVSDDGGCTISRLVSDFGLGSRLSTSDGSPARLNSYTFLSGFHRRHLLRISNVSVQSHVKSDHFQKLRIKFERSHSFVLH